MTTRVPMPADGDRRVGPAEDVTLSSADPAGIPAAVDAREGATDGPAPAESGPVAAGPVAALDRLDEHVDGWWERHFRGRRRLDQLFYTASEAANHSMLWHCLGVAQAIVRRDPRLAAQVTVVLGMESALVNGGLKSMFRRRRPAHTGSRPYKLRQPFTSSFPSGHASSAMVAAALLSRRTRWAPAWYALAVIVAVSRIHTRIHHTSDVVAGIIVGAAVGRLATRVLPSPGK